MPSVAGASLGSPHVRRRPFGRSARHAGRKAGRWLGRVVLVASVLAAFGMGVAQAQQAQRDAEAAQAIESTVEEEDVLPEGDGRSETFGYCTACHSTALIRRSRFTRPQWDGLMDWMTERHGMNPLEGEFRELIVDYLAQHYGPAQAPARGRNPFLN